MSSRFLFKKSSVSVEELSADSCLWETWCTCNRYLAERRNFDGKFASFLNKFARGNYQYDSSETLALYCHYCPPLQARPDFLSMRRIFVSYCHPIRFARYDGKSLNRRPPVLDEARALDLCHRPEGSWALGTRRIFVHDPVFPSSGCSFNS